MYLLVGQIWLVLSLVKYYKRDSDLVIEPRNEVPKYLVAERPGSEVTNAYTADKYELLQVGNHTDNVQFSK